MFDGSQKLTDVKICCRKMKKSYPVKDQAEIWLAHLLTLYQANLISVEEMLELK